LVWATRWTSSRRKPLVVQLRRHSTTVTTPTQPPAAPADPRVVAQLIDELDAADHRVRTAATARLRPLVDRAGEPIAEALATTRSAEVQRRLEELTRPGVPPTGEQLRAVRAVEVAEWIATPDARALLDRWADGLAGARLTTEARAALARLGRS
jgi:hypothetical protein